MALFKKLVGSCTGKGFVANDANGLLKNFYDWINSGVAGWNVWDDRQTNPDYYIVICDDPSPTVNKVAAPGSGLPPKFIQIGYNETGFIYIKTWMWWDNSTHVGIGLWDGRKLHTVDSGVFGFDFRGGDECMMISTIDGTTIHQFLIDELVAIPGHLDDKTKVTTVISPVTANPGVTVINVADASVFNEGEYYYITDFSAGNSWVDYVRVTNVNSPIGTVTIHKASYNYTSGSIIGAYPHRFYIACNTSLFFVTAFSDGRCRIPYYSGTTTTEVWQQQPNWIKGKVKPAFPEQILDRIAPNDQGLYAVMHPGLVEFTNGDYSSNSMNRMYGTTKNSIICSNSGMLKRISTRILGGTTYLYVLSANEIEGSSNHAFLILDTESI